MTSQLDPFVGKFFHTFEEDGDYRYQGHVLAAIGDEHVEVVLFSWLTGAANGMFLWRFDALVSDPGSRPSVVFYNSAEEMDAVFQANRRDPRPRVTPVDQASADHKAALRAKFGFMSPAEWSKPPVEGDHP